MLKIFLLLKILRVKSDKVVYSDIEPPNESSNVVFKTTFINGSNVEQDFALRTERRSTSTWTLEVTEGYTSEHEEKFGLELEFPSVIAQAGAQFKKSKSNAKMNANTLQNETSWSMDSSIKVQPFCELICEILQRELEYKSNFQIKSYIDGYVNVKVYKDHKTCLLKYELEDLEDIFTYEKGFRKDEKGLYMINKGVCNISLGIDHRIQLTQIEDPKANKK